MFEYITGKLIESGPSHAVVDNQGIGYFLNISIYTSSKLKKGEDCKLFIHQIIREDANIMFAFFSKEERELFRMLISVNGVGPNTARLILSSVPYSELLAAIAGNRIEVLKGVKGIGLKTAQRIVIDLKDKISDSTSNTIENFDFPNNTLAKDSLSALTMLGFPKSAVQKTVNKIIEQNIDNKAITVEEVVKQALNYL